MNTRGMTVIWVLTVSSLALSGLGPMPQDATTTAERENEQAVSIPGAIEFAPGVWSGRAPGRAFTVDDLKSLGFESVLSVDGAPSTAGGEGPEGLTLAHLPLGYDGIHGQERLDLARAIRDLPRPLYIHCHHGKHRGPAAAAFGLICNAEISNEDAAALLKRAGTAYAGLFNAVEDATPLDQETIDTGEFPPPEARVVGMQASMVEIDRVWEHIKLCAEAGWQTPEDHPDLVPELEAARLENLFRSLSTDPETPRKMGRWMRSAATNSARLESELRRLRDEPYRGLSDARDAAWFSVESDCNACHARFRD